MKFLKQSFPDGFIGMMWKNPKPYRGGKCVKQKTLPILIPYTKKLSLPSHHGKKKYSYFLARSSLRTTHDQIQLPFSKLERAQNQETR